MLKVIHTFLLIIFLTSNALAADKITISAAFEPKELALGRRGLLTITVSGSKNAASPTLPEIDGLVIRSLGTQQNIQMTNGATTISSTYSFTVMPQRSGEFSLPNFDWEINGQKYSVSSPTAKLKVLAQGMSAEDEVDRAFDLKVTFIKDKIFVGQMIPVTIALYAPINVPGQISLPPKIEGNNFMGYGYLDGTRSITDTDDGTKKQVITYQSYITSLKSGDSPLQYKMGLIIQSPIAVGQSRPSTNNFFESIFGNMMVNTNEEIEPSSIPEMIHVAPLPVAGKPENFTGAIGEFKIESLSVTHEEAQVGDPITLKLAVKGSGNMDRISAPVLNVRENWKAYTPKSSFNKEDAFGFTGTKIFEYIIIPQNDKITETPSITFSFFNPETGRYSELTPNPVALKIAPASESSMQTNSSNSITKANITPSSNSHEPELLHIKLGIENQVKTLRPLMTKAFFTPSIIGIAVTLGVLLVLIKKRKLKHDHDAAYLKQINTERTIHLNLQKVRKAYAKHHAEEFYHAASIVILEIVARHHKQSSQALNFDDAVNFLKEKGLPEEHISYVKTLFHTTDMLKFSGVPNEQKLTSESLKNFESLINELEKCC